MNFNTEDLKNKIIYRASYRGTKEMDKLMIAFVKFILKDINDENLIASDSFVNMDDNLLMSVKKNETLLNITDSSLLQIVEKFKKFNL